MRAVDYCGFNLEPIWKGMQLKIRILFLIVSMLLIVVSIHAQKSRVIPQRTLSGPANGGYGAVSWGLRLSYFSPNLSNVGSAFNRLENSAGLPHGSIPQVYYLAGATIRCSLDRRNDIGVEGEMNYGQSKLSNVYSFTRVYGFNVQYFYHLQERTRGYYGVDIGAGAGWITANFERNYGDDHQRIAVLAQSARVNGAVQWWASLSRSLYFEVEGRYVYVPEIRISQLQAPIKMSSLQLSAGISVVP